MFGNVFLPVAPSLQQVFNYNGVFKKLSFFLFVHYEPPLFKIKNSLEKRTLLLILNLAKNIFPILLRNMSLTVIYQRITITYITFEMDKRPIGYQPGKGTVLDKKVPKTNKYDHVESKLAGKTGTTVKDIQFMSNKQVSKKNSELFKRIKPSTVWKMINQQGKTESIYNINHPEQDSRSQASNLTSITIKTEQLPVGVQTDFLLLDLRDQDQYEQYHIRQALSFPGPRIKQDKTIPQLFQYRNKEDKIIILYHFDEKRGIEYVNHFVEKGYDNVYLLSGGIEAFGQEIQEGLEGKKVPVFEKKQQKKVFKKKRVQ